MIGKRLNAFSSVDADYYFSAGDQVSWGRGLDRVGEILRTRGDKVYVLPGNHESAARSPRCAHGNGLHHLHERHITIGRWQWPGWVIPVLRRSTRRANTPKRNWPNAWRRFAELKPLVLICHAPPFETRSTRCAPGCMPDPRRCAISSRSISRNTSSAATSTKRRAWRFPWRRRARGTWENRRIC